MTGDAHAHRQRIGLRYAVFRFDWTMTGLAANAGRHVTAVVEHRVIRQVVHLDPFDWFVLLQRRSDLLDIRGVLFDLGMAVHAGAGGGNAGDLRFVRRRVAIETLNLVIARVHFVRKVDRLRGLITLLVAESPKD